ncbi:MAG: choice-of-anchor D domain-containing protein [Candidatus Kapaibacterium sp.]
MNYSDALRKLILLTLFGLSTLATVSAQRVDPLNFGEVRCGESACEVVQIRSLNLGETIVQISLRDSTTFLLGADPVLPRIIPNQDSVELSLCFSPLRTGNFTDVLQLIITDTVDQDIDTVEVQLSGIGIGPNLQLDPPILRFAETEIGKTSTQQVVVRNVGQDPIDLDLSQLAGIVDPYRIVDDSIFPVTIDPNGSVVIEVEFAPTSQGYISVYTDIRTGCNQKARLLITGNTPDMLEEGFGEVPCDEVACDTVWVKGEGPNDRVRSIRMRDSVSFFVGKNLSFPITLPVGDSIGIPVCFQPSRRGNIIDSLVVNIERGGLDEAIRVRLKGTGIGPNVEIDPIVLNFPRTAIAGTSQLTTRFTNSGERPLLVTEADLMIPAPFRLVTPLPIELAPGESIDIEIEFAPTETGIFSRPVDVTVGCNRLVQIGLNGSTDFIGTGGVLRVTKIGFNPANDERVPCDVSQCTDVTLSNVGNATLVVDSLYWFDGGLGYTAVPFSPIRLTIPPNESTVVKVCIDAKRAGTLVDSLYLRSNDRRSIAFGIVFDASRSMVLDSIRCSPNTYTRLREAKVQAKAFIDNTLLYLPSLDIQDQLAIIHYSSERKSPGSQITPVINTSYPLEFITDPGRTVAKASIDAITEIGGTYTGAALRAMIDTLKKSPLKDRVIVLISDGKTDDNLNNLSPVSTIINEANAAGVKIFSIGIALSELAPTDFQDARDYLTTLSRRTNGKEFLIEDCGSLQDAFAEITEIVSQGGTWVEPFKITVSAPQLIADNVRFDSLYIYDDSCMTVTLTNVGEGTAIVNKIDLLTLAGDPSTEFTLDGASVSFPIQIPENGQRDVVICFRPEKLREREAALRAVYNSCFDENATAVLNGTGYAEANLRITDVKTALPGDVVTLPIYGDSSLANYDVNSIVWTLRWNRTMLELQSVRPGAEANGASVVQSGPIVENGRYAEVELRADGPALLSAGELAQLDFEFLRGDSLAAYVEITSGTFEDANPKMLVKNAGVVIHDSICFRELRAIEFRGTPAKIAVTSVSPTPATGDRIDLELTSTNKERVFLDLYDAQGATTILTEEYDLPEGDSRLTLNVSSLTPGVYYLRLRAARSSETVYRKLIIQK